MNSNNYGRNFPYDYMDSFARFDESLLPSQEAFYSKLSDSPCSDMEYAHATQVWTTFECESMSYSWQTSLRTSVQSA